MQIRRIDECSVDIQKERYVAADGHQYHLPRGDMTTSL